MLHFLTFADTSMSPTLERIRHQAETSRLFDKVHACSELSLPQDLRYQYRNRMYPFSRGYGYWMWKPYLVRKLLLELKDDDVLLYADAGCHVNSAGRTKLDSWLSQVALHPTGVLAFQNVHQECKWTKGDLFQHLDVALDSPHAHSGQLVGTSFAMRRTTASTTLCDTWWNLVATQPWLVNDSPSSVQNHPSFVEHRHDQSVFSLLCKRIGTAVLPSSEIESMDRSQLADSPVQALRDRPRKGRVMDLHTKADYAAGTVTAPGPFTVVCLSGNVRRPPVVQYRQVT